MRQPKSSGKFSVIAVLSLLVTPAMALTGTVVSVTDGDTLTVLDSNRVQHRIRLADIDAPEKKQPFGQQAKQMLSNLCYQKSASVQVTARDRYGREVGNVTCAGKDANLSMVRSGLAWDYVKYNKRPEITEAEGEARRARRGLWKDAHPIPPWDWRKSR